MRSNAAASTLPAGATPRLTSKRYVETHGDGEGLDAILDALRSACARVAPAAPTSTAAAVTPLDDAPLATTGQLTLGLLAAHPPL